MEKEYWEDVTEKITIQDFDELLFHRDRYRLRKITVPSFVNGPTEPRYGFIVERRSDVPPTPSSLLPPLIEWKKQVTAIHAFHLGYYEGILHVLNIQQCGGHLKKSYVVGCLVKLKNLLRYAPDFSKNSNN